MKSERLPQGADLIESGVRYRVWSPQTTAVRVEAQAVESGETREIPLIVDASGYHSGIDHAGCAGDTYKYRLDDKGSYPDPASRWQPSGPHGPSMVIDPLDFVWHDRHWKCPEFRDLAIYELHVGAFTPEGTFLAAIDKLDYLRDLGVTAIELMPIADFPGDRNWGYDGVALFAPARAYGHPDDLRALVDASHRAGVAVILDVVYNHFGPDGNYLGAFSAGYFNRERKTPWGDSFNYDGPHSGPVRAFFVSNAPYWREEFHIDGFRLDATHEIEDESPRHILEEITSAVHALGGFCIAEDARNAATVVMPPRENGLGFDGVWADDFHHAVRVAHTGEAEAYMADFTGATRQLVETLRHGWLYRGQFSKFANQSRGTECLHLSPQKFIYCISNHDQVGNRAFGDRFNHKISAEGYRAASCLLCLTPYTPMLFMGQEWGASSPFIFFTDHNSELGALITEGRRKEFEGFADFKGGADTGDIPDPQDPETFERSKLIWSELSSPSCVGTLALYKSLLRLRSSYAAFRPRSRDTWLAEELALGCGALRMQGEGADWLVLFDFAGGHSGKLSDEWVCKPPGRASWELVLASNEDRFGGTGDVGFDAIAQTVNFQIPQVVVLTALHD